MTKDAVSDEEVRKLMEFDEQKEMLEFQRFIQKSIINDSRVNDQTIRKYGAYTDSDVQRFLENPRAHERELRHVSRYLENTSQMYKRIVDYLPSIAIDCPIVVPTKERDGHEAIQQGG